MDNATKERHSEIARILESAESWLHKCANRSRSFVSESKASSKTRPLQPQILIAPLRHLRHEAPRFAHGATQLCWCDLWIDTVEDLHDPSCFNAPLVESVRQCKKCARTNRTILREARNLVWALFLLRYVWTTDLLEFPFQPFCLLEVAGVIMLLLGAFWFKPGKIEDK